MPGFIVKMLIGPCEKSIMEYAMLDNMYFFQSHNCKVIEHRLEVELL